MQIGDVRGQSVVVCVNRDHGLVTPIFRTWPERFAAAYIREMKHFIACIRTGARPRAGGAEGRWAVAGVLAATRSFLEECSVRLAEVFVPPAAARRSRRDACSGISWAGGLAR